MHPKEKKLVIFIGNGYDKAYQYKTGYDNFIESAIFLDLVGNNKLATHIKEIFSIKKWADLESELFNYSKLITKIHGEGNEVQAKLLENEFYELKRSIYKYLQNSSNGYSNKVLDELQKEWIYNNSELQIEIICFNYTPTINTSIYNLHLTDKCKIHHIHGYLNYNLADATDAIVLGIDETMRVEENHGFLYKSKSESLDIKGIKEIINSSEKYIIFGCSLGETDTWYFKDIFKCKKKSFGIYYHGPSDYKYITDRIIELSGSLHTFRSENEVFFYDSNDLLNHVKTIKKNIVYNSYN